MKSASNAAQDALPEFPPNDLTAGVDWARDDHALSIVNGRTAAAARSTGARCPTPARACVIWSRL